MKQRFYDIIDRKIEIYNLLKTPAFFHQVDMIGKAISGALRNGNKLLVCGNGGSASDANHFVGELVGRFLKDRIALPAISLSTNAANITCISNDFGYENVFSRQVEGLGRDGDVLVGITTSGTSRNVINALKSARENHVVAIAFTGSNTDNIDEICDFSLSVPSDITARIQEIHILVIHTLCEYIERELGLC